MSLDQIALNLQREVTQAAAIADIMCVFSCASGASGFEMALDDISDGMGFIYYTLETHMEKLSAISEQLTNYMKNKKGLEKID